MKKSLLLASLFIFNISFCQVPDGFNVVTINDVDSAIYFLTKAARSQPHAPMAVDITKDYISQQRGGKKMNLLTGNARTTTIVKANYYENITRVNVARAWSIHLYSSITETGDYIVIKNKEMAEKAYAALLCLIRNSENSHYDTIINPPQKRKKKNQKLFQKNEVDSINIATKP